MHRLPLRPLALPLLLLPLLPHPAGANGDDAGCARLGAAYKAHAIGIVNRAVAKVDGTKDHDVKCRGVTEALHNMESLWPELKRMTDYCGRQTVTDNYRNLTAEMRTKMAAYRKGLECDAAPPVRTAKTPTTDVAASASPPAPLTIDATKIGGMANANPELQDIAAAASAPHKPAPSDKMPSKFGLEQCQADHYKVNMPLDRQREEALRGIEVCTRFIDSFGIGDSRKDFAQALKARARHYSFSRPEDERQGNKLVVADITSAIMISGASPDRKFLLDLYTARADAFKDPVFGLFYGPRAVRDQQTRTAMALDYLRLARQDYVKSLEIANEPSFENDTFFKDRARSSMQQMDKLIGCVPAGQLCY